MQYTCFMKVTHAILTGALGLCVVAVGTQMINVSSSVFTGNTLSQHIAELTDGSCSADCAQELCDSCVNGQMHCNVSSCDNAQCITKEIQKSCLPEGVECLSDSDCEQPVQPLHCINRRGLCQREIHISTCAQGSCIQHTLYKQCATSDC